MTVSDGLSATFERIDVEDSTQVPTARALAVEVARQLDMPPVTVDRIALAATELAQNLYRHASGGELIVAASPADDRLVMIAVDRGPGVAHFDRCLVDGYSTAGTMGTGLGAVQRLAADFDAVSEPDVGTAVSAGFAIRGPAPVRARLFDVGAVGFPIDGEVVNGDTFAVAQHGTRLTVLLADGLGHGPFAADASRAAAQQLDHIDADPQTVLRRVNDELATTRGAAVTVADLDVDVALAGGTMRSSGLGNVSLLVALPDGTTKRIVTAHGTAGAKRVTRLSQQVNPFPALGTLVLHTDGLSSRWDLSGRTELLRHSSLLVAAVLWRDHVRGTDDSMVVVIKARMP